MLTPRENLLETINFGNPEYVPLSYESIRTVGLPLLPLLEQPRQNGPDPYGIRWVITPAGAMHDTTVPPLLDDIENWRDVVKIPDISHIDFKAAAEAELKDVDRSQQALAFCSTCGCYERLAAYMGFENALVAMAEDPDETRAFMEAITDHKIEIANKVIDAYGIDIYYNFDDIATANNLFISPATYREVIKPCHERLAKAVTDRGVIFGEHTCGKCEDILEDYVEIGAKIWHSAQTMNDLKGIQDKFHGRLTIEGGWDSSGRPGCVDATVDEIRAETIRCMEDYGKKGGFILCPLMFNERGNSLIVGDDRTPVIVEEWEKRRFF